MVVEGGILVSGFLVADIVVAGLDRIAEPGELVLAPKGIRLCVGGHPANVSIDLVKLGLDGRSITLVGTVGRDVFGDFIIDVLSSYGINLVVDRVGVGTNKNVILVVRGEDRRFHVEVSSSRYLDPVRVVECVKRFRPSVFYLAAGIVDRTDERLGWVFGEAKRVGCLTFLDVVKPFGKGWDFVWDALRYVDVFHCNDVEVMDLTGEGDLRRAVGRLLDEGVGYVFVTLGGRGALLACDRFLLWQPAFEVEVVDPTGAGDAFCAGVIFKLLEMFGGKVDVGRLSDFSLEDFSRLLAFAQAVGACACTAPGATEGVSFLKVRELLEAQLYKVVGREKIEGWE